MNSYSCCNVWFKCFLAGIFFSLGCGQAKEDLGAASLVRKLLLQSSIKEAVDRETGQRHIVKLVIGSKHASQLLPQLKNLPKLHELNLAGVKLQKKDFEQLMKISSLECLRLSSGQLTDNDMQYLQPLKGLETLVITHSTITDDGLPYLSTMTELRYLNLSSTKVCGHGFSRLQGLTKLNRIDLSYTDLEDSAMQYFRTYQNLKAFHFSSTCVTEKGLMELVGLQELRDIAPPDDIVGPKLTDAANIKERHELTKERRREKKALWARFWKARLASIKQLKAAGKPVPSAEHIKEIKETIRRYDRRAVGDYPINGILH